MNIIYFNQNYIEKEKARIPVMDRGFLFGDSVYEVIPYFNGQPLGQTGHIQRLQRSLTHLNIPINNSIEQWRKILDQLISLNNLGSENFSIYIQISRGAMEYRAHTPEENIQPTLVAFCMPMNQPNPLNNHKAILAEDTRHNMCHIKSTNLLANTVLLQSAYQQDALEVILHKNGFITECSSSNVFIVKNKIIVTPPQNNNILSGITRGIVLNLAKKHKLPHQEAPISIAELKAADEIWVTSSTKQICPITQLENNAVGNGNIGSVWKTLSKLFNQHLQTLHGPKETSL
jgi:D-alanine transaminase